MNGPTAEIENGFLRGSFDPTVGGKPYYSFKGIYFADPTDGPRRFKVRHSLALNFCHSTYLQFKLNFHMYRNSLKGLYVLARISCSYLTALPDRGPAWVLLNIPYMPFSSPL